MTPAKAWNNIVEHYNKNMNSKEEVVQSSWEVLFSTVFGYDDADIDSQRTIKLGATERGKPDIILKKDGEDIFVVELKRYTLHDGREQLFSYLNQLKMNIGIVVCDTLGLYDYDFTQKESPYSELEISFTPDNPDGEAFVEMFSKGNFDSQKVKNFIASRSRAKSNLSLIKNALSESLIIGLLKDYFAKQYPKEDVENALSGIHISIGNQTETPLWQAPVLKDKTPKPTAPVIPQDGKTSVTIKGVTIPIYRSSSQSLQDFVKQTLKILFDKNLLSEGEIVHLQDFRYSQRTFGIQHPLLEKDARKTIDGAGHSRYWSNFRVQNFYVCSQWWKSLFSSYESKIAAWLISLEKDNGQ